MKPSLLGGKFWWWGGQEDVDKNIQPYFLSENFIKLIFCKKNIFYILIESNAGHNPVGCEYREKLRFFNWGAPSVRGTERIKEGFYVVINGTLKC